jgi:metal-dependent amidase/aminoacylase/carboxypeptidase family protein
LINAPRETDLAAKAAAAFLGADKVLTSIPPTMGSEDFASMLLVKPGAYVFLGQAGSPNSCSIHNPLYDFNDESLVIGSGYWVSLVEHALPMNTA